MKTILGFAALFIAIAGLVIIHNLAKPKECDTIKVYPGDTIIFRHPNIPKNLRYEDASITFYQKHVDSVVIVYDNGCK